MTTIDVSHREFFTICKRLLPFASTEATRWYLNSVYLDPQPDGKTLRMVALNGHIMGINQLQALEAFEGMPPVLIAASDVRKILSVFKRPNATDWPRITLEGGNLSVTDGEATLTVKPMDATYPDYASVIPQNVQEVHHGVKAEYLGKVLSALRGKVIRVQQAARDDSAYSITAGGGDTGEHYVVMPCRVIHARAAV